MVLALSACAASTREVTTPSQGTTSPHGVDQPQSTACDARTLSWSVGQLADDALIERARREAGANTVRVLRPGMMITNEVDPSRLNLRIDNARKVLVYSCG
ncbi:MAG: I78 family peptidase inhibitor [Luteimonas sp.]